MAIHAPVMRRILAHISRLLFRIEVDMTLLELLVKELPGRGGWPKWCHHARKHTDHNFFVFYDAEGRIPGDYPDIDVFNHEGLDITINVFEYEAAIAASKQVVWDGEGLPPVGTMVEIIDPYGYLKYGQGESGEVISHVENTAVVRMSYGLGCFGSHNLQPIRTEADRKREETVEIMRSYTTNYNKKDVIHSIGELYDAIAAGKIPGIQLTPQDKK